MRIHPLAYTILLAFAWLLLTIPSAQAAEKDCSCPKVTCGPCQKKVSIGKEVRFCSWGNINVCKKFVCENVAQYFQCLTKKQGQKDTPQQPEENLVLDYEETKQKARKKRKAKRGVSAISLDEEEKDRPIDYDPEGLIPVTEESLVREGFERSTIVVGKVASGDKKLSYVHYRMKQPLTGKPKVFVGDEFINETKKDKKFKIDFEGQGTATFLLTPGSKLTVLNPNSIMGRFQPFFQLLYGAATVTVDFEKGPLDFLSGQVLARIQKGQTTISYEVVDKSLKVKVESLKGKVKVIRANNLSDPGVDVNQGSYLTWYTDYIPSTDDKKLASEEDQSKLNDPGVISPVFAMSEAQRKELGLLKEKASVQFKDWVRPADEAQDKTEMRNPASVEDEEAEAKLCKAPQGQFQQCAWSCEGNADAAKECEANIKGTYCVRRVCNADGEWSHPTPFASSYRDLCPATGVRVGSCRP